MAVPLNQIAEPPSTRIFHPSPRQVLAKKSRVGPLQPATEMMYTPCDMPDADCVAFLQWALPHMRLRWAGFRRVRRQVCRRLRRRAGELGLRDLAQYRRYLENDPREWPNVDDACRITISRFYRDRRVFQKLAEIVLPCLAAGDTDDRRLRCLSLGCASGEEPYTLAILWRLELAADYPELTLCVDAVDADGRVLERAARGCYRDATLRELPERWRLAAFEPHGSQWRLKDVYRRSVRFLHGDIRSGFPARRYHLILCRNLAFTYYDTALQGEVLSRITDCLHPGGALVVGTHETLPAEHRGLTPWPNAPHCYRRLPDEVG